MEESFSRAGLPFSFRDFGTDYKIVSSELINRKLLGPFPFKKHTKFELFRNQLINYVPYWSRLLMRQDNANLLLINTALNYFSATHFVENGHSAARLRCMSRLKNLDFTVIYLTRSPYAVIKSMMKNHGWNLDTAISIWFRNQINISETLPMFGKIKIIRYEDICSSTESTLNGVFDFIGVSKKSVSGNFGLAEHHILGNVMRFEEKTIRRTQKINHALPSDEKQKVFQALARIRERSSNPLLVEALSYYMPEKTNDFLC